LLQEHSNVELIHVTGSNIMTVTDGRTDVISVAHAPQPSGL